MGDWLSLSRGDGEIMQNYTWPPAIPPPVLPVQDSIRIKALRMGKASLWLAGVGIVASFAVMQDSGLFIPGGLDQPMSGYFVSAYVGLVCDFLGLLLGILGRKTAVGKIGLSLSFLALVSIPALGLAYHAHNGNWPWLTLDDCNCP